MNGTTAESHDGTESSADAPESISLANTTTTNTQAPSIAAPEKASEEDVTTRALRFLSTASPETIGGIAVALAASTYVILGRLGLILIGALGGIVLHAAWEGKSAAVGSLEDQRREKGVDIVKRILDLRDVTTSTLEEENGSEFGGSSFDGFQPETAAALTELVDAVIRDYVKWVRTSSVFA